MDDIYIKLIYIIIISIAHYGIVNKIEKIFSKLLFPDNKIINRPLDKCKDSHDFNFSCIGMPSGHTEGTTILCLLLNYYDLLPLPMAILTIFVVGLHRIVTNMHNIQQVSVGLLFGLLYTQLYINTDTSFTSLLILFGIIIFSLIIISLLVDDNKLNYRQIFLTYL